MKWILLIIIVIVVIGVRNAIKNAGIMPEDFDDKL